jgi:hypothetical protein
MSAHPGAHSFVSVPISSFVGSGLPLSTETSESPLKKIQIKFFWKCFMVAIFQMLGVIVTTALYYSGSEPAAYVVICMSYFSTYFLVVLAGFIESTPPNLEIEVNFAWLRHKFIVLKFLLIIQISCIYLQRAIVPDLWPFGVAFVMFLVMTVFFIKSCWMFYNFDDTKKWYLLTLVFCSICCVIAQIVFFCIFASTYGTTSHVQSKLQMGALFVPIFFGQIANIVMIVMTKNWEVNPEVSGTEV